MKKRGGGSSWMLLVALVVVVVVVVLCEMMSLVDGTGGNLSPGQCKEEGRLLVDKCRPLVFGQPPSPACCARVRVTHVDCVCPIDPKLAALITLDLVTKTLKTCGRAVPHHLKCGSITFP